MWNDEDNNPYAAFDRRDSTNSDAVYPGSPGARPLFPATSNWQDTERDFLAYRRPSTPPSEDEDDEATQDPPEFLSRPRDLSDESLEDDRSVHHHLPAKKGGYTSRIEQILYENPDLQIEITYAGKNLESGGSYIAYTIRTGVRPLWQEALEHANKLRRTSRYGEDIRNLHRCGKRSSTYTQH